MSGHNKWSQIKHKKAKEDAKRGKAFTILTKEITVAAKEGGGDPAMNARLRFLLEKARDINMPADNTKRAIQRGTGELPGVSYEPYQYEGYGPYGMAVIVDTLSDNKNRTVATMRHTFSRFGGNVGESGSVSWMFERQGVVRGPVGSLTEDALLEALLDADIIDVQIEGDQVTVYCAPRCLDQVRKRMIELGIKVEHAELEWVAKTYAPLSEEHAEKAVEFLSALEELDDVQHVYANME